MTDYLKFKQLHHESKPFLLGNVWNVQSAKVFEQLGFDAIGTSSAAITHTLGYQDGEQMPFKEMLFIVKKIRDNTLLPLSVDLEFGYGQTPNAIADNIEQLAQLNVVGINLEDSYLAASKRQLTPALTFYRRLKEITTLLRQRNISIFINVRCDAFLLEVPDTLHEAATRIEQYQSLDIDGIFSSCLKSISAMKYIIERTHLPLNLMCVIGLPDFNTMAEIGIKRISMGNSLNDLAYSHMGITAERILKEQSFLSIL